MSLDLISLPSSDILSESEVNTLGDSPRDFDNTMYAPKSLSLERENWNPRGDCADSKKNCVHLRYNRTRNPPPNPRCSQKHNKLAKVNNDLRSILRNSNEKQLLHSQSFQLEPPKENYPILLKRKNSTTCCQQEYQELSEKEFQQILTISHGDINFGKVLPGSIIEQLIEVRNRTDSNLAIRINVTCLDAILNEMDEYVFSVAELNKYNYHEKLLVILEANSSTKFSMGLKVPNIKEEKMIEGNYKIEIIGLNKIKEQKLQTSTRIPKLQCLKEIYDVENKIFILKFALKTGKKQDFKVFFKNENEIPIEGNFEVMESQTRDYELMLYPSNVRVEALSMCALNLMVKPKGVALKNMHQSTTINKVLLLKVRNSSLIYFFALAIELY